MWASPAITEEEAGQMSLGLQVRSLLRKIKQHKQRCEYGEGHEKQMDLTREKI